MNVLERWMMPAEGKRVIRVDGYFLYQVGALLRPLTQINTNWTRGQVLGLLWAAEAHLDAFLNRSLFKLRTSWPSGNTLIATMKRLKDEYSKDDVKYEDKVTWYDQYSLSSEAKTFETVLSAELQFSLLYLVQPKGGYDLLQLAENGIAIFPPDLIGKVPEAIADAREAAREVAPEI